MQTPSVRRRGRDRKDELRISWLGGRYDFIFPEQTLQVPFLESLGATATDKRRVMYDTGHNLPRMEMMKETLDWLDRYLGPVDQR